MQRLLFVTFLFLAVQTTPASAQTGEPASTSRLQRAEAAVSMSPPLAQSSTAQAPSLKRRIGRMFVGGLVGGWSGYFASHIAVSDWEDGDGIGTHRGTWAAAGLVAGVVAGHFLSGGRGAPPDLRPSVTATRQTVTREEILASGANNGRDLLYSIRREWLMPRGVNSFRESARGSVTDMSGADFVVVAGDDHVLVYLDNSRLGGTQHLAEISLASIEKIEFIEPAEATFRWGTGHAHGVIHFTTLSAKPPQN